MKSSELRIGNWVEQPNDGVTRVTAILNDLQIKTETGYIDKYCRPIPLTEEWLLRFGFDKLTEKGSGFKSTSYTYTGKVALIVHFDGVRLSVNFWQGNEKKYVHQLQNLYFALTGEELTLKEKQDA